jgi:hypothetical protein
MYKIYQTNIDTTRLVGEFRTLEEAQERANLERSRGVGIITIVPKRLEDKMTKEAEKYYEENE